MSSRSVSSPNEIVVNDAERPPGDLPGETAEEKPSHDASVFVGSLPCNVDQAELTKLLSEHLSEYAEIKNIKVVRDTKGGICAFVQCESADAASDLIQSLHSQKPKPFMGRILRFEPARAFRTLLISYRAPIDTSLGHPHPNQPGFIPGLPTAMRIWKPKGARFHNILYNHDAVQAETHARQDTLESEDSGIFLQPLKFDEQTMQVITSYFGRVEKFSVFQLDSVAEGGCNVEGLWQSYPAPHNSPRSPVMDEGCWEVKWDFRDDCVSALMALRRVPHLSVTWAHQPSYSGWECRYPNYGHFPQTIPTPYPFQSHLTPHVYPTSPGFPHSSSIPPHALQGRAPSDHEGSDKNPLVDVPDMARHVGSHQPTGYLPHPVLVQPSFTEPITEWNGWKPSNSTESVFTSSSVAVSPDICHRSSFMPQNAHLVNGEFHLGPLSEGAVAIPLSPVGNGPFYPPIPSNATEDATFVHRRGLHETPTQRNIDPFSLFVGGLEVLGPSAWNEEKVRQHFAKYGGLQSVKFVRPFNGTTGFAFLKFDNTDSPARAVLEEHNRVCNGHVMRVRLRDCNPPRNNWKQGRGRGRLYHHSGGKFQFPDRFDLKPPSVPKGGKNEMQESRSLSSQQANVETRSLSRNSHASPSTDGQTLHDESPPPSPPLSEKSDGAVSLDANAAQEPHQRYREWYDNLDTPPSAAIPVSTSMTVFPPPPYPYVFPNLPYYGSSPWVQPYIHHQASYPVPYFNAYPVYPPHMMRPPFHPIVGGEQDGPQALQQGWTPQGVVYSPSYYAVPTPFRPQPAGDQRSSPPGQDAPPVTAAMMGVSEQTDSGCQMNGVSRPHPPPPPPSNLSPSPSKASFPSEPSMKFRNSIILPEQPPLANGAPRTFTQPPHPSWSNNTHIVGPVMNGTQSHASMHQPHFPQHNAPVPENGGRPQHPNGRRRQSFKRDAQAHFHGNRGVNYRGHNGQGRMNNFESGGPTHHHNHSANGPMTKGKPPPQPPTIFI